MRVGILGASGFVGGSLLKVCEATPEVSYVQAFSRKEFDLTQPNSWAQQLEGFDCVVNAATKIDGHTYDIFAANCLFACPLSEYLNRKNIGKLINISTGAVYGEVSDPTSHETPCHPSGDYAVSKYLSEKLFLKWFQGKTHNIRLYFPFGPAQKPHRLIPNLIDAIIHRKEIHCDKRGGPIISLSPIQDVCKIIVNDFILADNPLATQNIAGPHCLSIAEIAHVFAQIAGEDAKIWRKDEICCDKLSVPYDRWRWSELDFRDIIQTALSASKCPKQR